MVQEIQKKEFNEIIHEATWRGKKITLKTGKLAPHCDGAVEVTMEGTKLLVTVVMNKNPDENKERFPLGIDFRESYYAAWKIGWWRYRKREWRPSDETILYCRLTDRPMRPMFPKGMINDVVITISPLSLDLEHSPGELSILGASVWTMLAGIPFEWPIGWVRIWYIDGEYVVNMTQSQAEHSIMDLHVAGTATKINMIEAWGNETPMDVIKWWMRLAQEAIAELCAIQNEFLAQCTITPQTITKNKPADDMIAAIRELLSDEKLEALHWVVEKNHWDATYKSYEDEIKEALAEKLDDDSNDWKPGHVREAFFLVIKGWIRERTLSEGIRVDGRWVDDIRQIHCEIDTVPDSHGTALFWRWDTQVLAYLTLGSPGDVEIKDGMEHDQTESRWFHHYKFPPFSNNEANMIRGTNRREVGHGRLAEKAIEAMLPDAEHFPYTMRVVSEVLGSGWSTSMAAVCGSTLAMMAWWVPLKKPVSGIAMGLMADDTQAVVLTDIKWTEDFTGDMDFKLAGTDEGMTAIQMDTKLKWLWVEKLEEMLDKAQIWRTAILAYMMKTISEPRKELNPSAPALLQFNVKPEEVRTVIGSWWSTIQEIIRETNVKIDLQDDGSWVITADNQEDAKKALELVMGTVWKPVKWDVIEWTITRVEKYWVFVALGNKKSWLCHVKQLWAWYIENVAALYKVGQPLKVEVIDIDAQWKVAVKNLTPTPDASSDKSSNA